MPNWVANHLIIHGENAEKVLRSVLTEDRESDDGMKLDFNKIIPMPDSLKIESGSRTNDCIELYMTSQNPQVDYYGAEKMPAGKFKRLQDGLNATKYFSKYDFVLSQDEIAKRLKYFSEHYQTPDFESRALLQGKTAVDNLVKYGAKDWYDWCNNNWGTKWNACNCQVYPDKAEVYFDTAWSPVPQILLALSEQNPDCQFEYEYAEEQAGNFAGHCVYAADEITVDECFETGSKECYEMFFKLWGCEDDYEFNEETGTYEYIENDPTM